MKKPVYYIANEVAEIFNRDPHTIRDWINHGCPTPEGLVRLQAAKLGKSWTIELRVRPDPVRPNLELEIPREPERETP
mgnify:CR=1 FL=1